MCGAVGGTRIVFNQDVTLPVGGSKKHFDMGERFVSRLPIVPLLTISRKNIGVEHKLVGIVHDLLGQVWCGAGVGICNGVINLPPDDLYGFGGGVCLAKAIVFHEPVYVGDDGVGLVKLGEQIQRAGSAIPSVRPLFYPHKVVLDGAQKLLTKGAVYVPKVVEHKRVRVVSVADGCCFMSSGACWDDGHRPGIWRGHYPCCREGCVDSGVKGEAKVSERATAKVCVDRRHV